MLTSDLLVVRKRKGEIQPRYAELSSQNLEVATQLIRAYENHVGEKRYVLQERVSDLEQVGYDYRFVRGLSALLDRRSVFERNVNFNPANLRRKIFQAVAEQGIPSTPQQRTRIIEHVAVNENFSVKTIEEGLYADLDSEMILKEFSPLSSEELIKGYNLSLTQTLLFNSTGLRFTASGNWQQIFYTVKRLGLIYEVFRREGFWVKIDGPASLFKLTRRYGTALAKLLPSILDNQEWKIKGKILWKYNNKIYDFSIESRHHRDIFGQIKRKKVSFDSSVEKDFATQFKALGSNWRLKREPEPVPAGRYVIIPDFSFQRSGIKIFMEIVGFWTEEYLRRKIKKLKDMEVNMLIAVDEKLACEKLERIEKSGKLNIVYYKKKVPLAPIIRHLENAFHEVKEMQKEFVKNLPITFKDPVVNYQEFAHRIGVSTEAVRTALATKKPKNYLIFPNQLVKKGKLEEISDKLEEEITKREKMSLPKAIKIIKKEGIQDSSNVLKHLGYQIRWQGINPKTTEVVKKEK